MITRHPAAAPPAAEPPRPPRRPRRRIRSASTLIAGSAALALLAGCATSAAEADDELRVVTTTGILADLASQVAGDRAVVSSIVPDGADPHVYEPSLHDVRDVVYADLAFSNYLMLEQQSIIRTLDANLRDGVPNVSLAEDAVKYAAEIIPLVEDVSLDTIWLGLRVSGDGEQLGADRSSDVLVSATAVDGPGELAAYLTGTFGDAEVYFDSSDGLDPGLDEGSDTVSLPPDAHTHLSWAFTEPGVYTLEVRADLRVDDATQPLPMATGEVVFAVGVDPHDVPGRRDATVLDAGHSDLTVDLDRGEFEILLDHADHEHQHQQILPLDEVVVEVPTKALHEVPADPTFRFLGRPGDPIYQLPQAVLGKHVHGEIDPHLWQDVGNAMSYVEIMRDRLIEVDPDGRAEYTANAAAYLVELQALDAEVLAAIAEVPRSQRTLVTTHDAFGYLAKAYDMTIAGFVSPNPAHEPSIAERARLTQTLRDLSVPAVFLEPELASRSSTLVEVAGEQGLAVCSIYGDAFDEHVDSYIDMMRANAHSIRDCLGGPRKQDR